jgi:predicted RecA/RadA family phage recombinase
MRNYRHDGTVLTFTAPSGGVVSGGGYIVGDKFVIAAIDAAVGTKFTGQDQGVFNLPKLSTDVIAEGVRVWWDATNSRVTVTATSNRCIGTAEAAAGNGVTTVDVLLTEAPLTAAGV